MSAVRFLLKNLFLLMNGLCFMPFSQRISIVKLFFTGMISIVVLMSCFHWGEWYFHRTNDFAKEISDLKASYITQQKESIRREVESAIEFSRFQRTQLENEARLELKNRIYEVHNLVTNLYQHYKNSKSEKEILALIKETLRNIRFNDNSYFFAAKMDGTAELFPFQPELEGQDLLALTDMNIQGITRDIIKLVKEQQEGFLRYTWFKPESETNEFDKLAFVKYFAPADWYIGTGFYYHDLEQKIQQTVLKRISEIRFGEDGFLFVLDFDSRMIAHPEANLIGNRMLDSQVKSIRDAFPKMLAETEQHGAFIEYSYRRPGHELISSKISYVARIPEWDWLVGAGFFLDTLDAAIAAKQQQLSASLHRNTWRMLLLSLFAIGCCALIARQVAAKLRKNVDQFSNFFARAASESIKIEPQDLQFSEFEQLALAANQMIDERCRSEVDREQLEAQLLQRQKLEAIGTLAGGIAHDFNNLLASICGNMTLLRMKLESESELNKYLDRINDATDNAKNLVAQILSFSRFSEGEKTCLDFAAEISEALALLRSSIPASVIIEADLPSQICPLLANKTQLHQVLMNICGNAYHALPNQTGTISLKLSLEDAGGISKLPVQPSSAQGGVAHLAISDTGTGIKQELLHKIFDPFFSTKEKSKGTGLGLSIAHRIISNHKGLIEVESQPDVGSTFHIYLPLASEQCPLEVIIAKPELVRGEGTILLVDDDQKVLLSTKELLQQLGYQVIDFNVPQEALAYLQKKHKEISVVISDQTMPGMSGLELIEKIRRIDQTIPIVLCTGYSDQINEDTTRSLQSTRLMMKPVDINQLSLHLSSLATAAATR